MTYSLGIILRSLEAFMQLILVLILSSMIHGIVLSSQLKEKIDNDAAAYETFKQSSEHQELLKFAKSSSAEEKRHAALTAAEKGNVHATRFWLHLRVRSQLIFDMGFMNNKPKVVALALQFGADPNKYDNEEEMI